MKLLKSETPFKINENEISRGPFPANGFLPIFETDFGNGDYYGFYWPLGRENQRPIICELFHDEGRLSPAFSSAAKLSQWLEMSESNEDDDESNIRIDDPLFSVSLLMQSQESRKAQQLDDALHYCESACQAFPEASDYWLTLASLYQQTRQPDQAAKAALNSYLSNWGFGIPNDKVLYFLQQASTLADLSCDPVVKQISLNSLNLNFGGTKTNQNYDRMKECIAEYFVQNKAISALKLSQNFAYAMYFETSAFQERYHFNMKEWQTEFNELCLKHLGDSRSSITIEQ